MKNKRLVALLAVFVVIIGVLGFCWIDQRNTEREVEKLFKPIDAEFKQSDESKERVSKAAKTARLDQLKKDRKKLNRTWRSYLDKSLELQKKELTLRGAISELKLELAKLELRQEQGEKLGTVIKDARSRKSDTIAKHQLAKENYAYNERQRALYLAKLKDFDVELKKVREHKDCPDCIESVKVSARKCKHCGYKFVLGH